MRAGVSATLALRRASHAPPAPAARGGRWFVDVADDADAAVFPDCLRFLAPHERDAVLAVRVPSEQRVAAASRLLQRWYGCHVLGVRWEEVGVVREGHGKPVLVGVEARHRGRAVHFNASHSHPLVVLVAHHHPVGVDVVQTTRRFQLATAKRHLPECEFEHVVHAADPQRAFHTHWGVREAVSKALGTGIAGGLRGIRVRGWQRHEWGESCRAVGGGGGGGRGECEFVCDVREVGRHSHLVCVAQRADSAHTGPFEQLTLASILPRGKPPTHKPA